MLRLIHRDDRTAVRNALRPTGGQHEGVIKIEARCRHNNGSWKYLAMHGRNLHDQPGIGGTLLNISDISEIKGYQAELMAAKETAEEMVRLKDSFLANMSHEIRTPLTGILGFAQVLKQEVGGEHQELVQFIQEGGKRLLNTLNSVLDLAQLEANTVQPSIKTIDLCQEVAECSALLEPLAVMNGLTFTLETPPDPLYVDIDKRYLCRIINNLVANAVKFTEQGGVAIAVEGDSESVAVRVRDTGTGISEDFMPYIFDEFKQESTGLSRSHEGSGLGLAITRKLVELLKGKISVRSKKGVGSEFVVTFPRQAQNTDRPTVDGARQDRPPKKMDSRYSILLVEDNPDTRLLITRILSDQYETVVATDGAEALAQAAKHSFDLVLMDISLGDGPDGGQVMRSLRTMDRYEDVPIIAVTAYALPGDRLFFINGGFDDYLSKPFRKEDLQQIIGRHLDKRQTKIAST
jgi:CheY-like chemotaxis protein/nitrogen-specific signal transduction histidine kinase